MTDPAGPAERVAAGRAALERHDWEAAHAALVAVDGEDAAAGVDDRLDADRLDLLAESLWWLGRIEECIEARQAAYHRYDGLGQHRQAAQCAVWLYEHHCMKARPAVGNGWLRRARRALGDDTDCAEWGSLLLREAETAHGAGDLSDAATAATAALELARRTGSVDLEAESLQTLGRLLIDDGRPREGLAHLDEAMLFAVEGRLRPYSTGKVYCSLVSACEEVGDLQRAAEWTEATSRWSTSHPHAIFPGLCRVKRAGVYHRRGDWEQAEREARQACLELVDVNVRNAAAAYAEIGEIRCRLGDYDGAEEAFGRAEDLCCQPTAGLAVLRLRQGRLDAATAIITGALAEQPWNRPARAKLLAVRVEIAIAAGDVDAAREAADQLAAIAADYDTPALLAASSTATGRALLAEERAGPACAALRDAVRRWQELAVPYEVASAQVLLGEASRAAGDEDAAVTAFRSAATTFRRLGAVPDARRADDARSGASLPCGLTEREAQVLALVARGSTNKEIAAELVLSQKTVARHLSNIFVKIGVTTRSAATAFAFTHDIAGAARG